MKKLLALTLLGALFVIAQVFTTGCTTTPTGQTVVDTNAVDKSAIVLRGTISDALLIAIEKDNGVVPSLKLIDAVLDKVLAGGDMSPATLRKAISQVRIKELNGPWAQLALGTALNTYELYWGDYIRGKIGGNYAADTLMRALKNGIEDALPKDGAVRPARSAPARRIS